MNRAPPRSPPPAAFVVHIDRLVIDGPALAAGDTARFERALSSEFTRLAEARQAPVPRVGAATPALRRALSPRPAAGADRVANLARQVAHSLFETLVEGAR